MIASPAAPATAADVLIVDDTPANLKVLGDLLRSAGFAVRPVPDGRLALAAARVCPPDLVLLDVRMPGLDGFTVCNELARDPRNADLPVIFISASDDPSDKVRAFAGGGVDYVTKPFHHDEVLARVRTHLRLRTLARELAAHNQRLEQEVAARTAELQAAHHRLERIDRTRAEFIACLAHILRTPANGVIGVGELLLRGHDRESLAPHFARARADLVALLDQVQAMADVTDLAAADGGGLSPAGAVIEAALARCTGLAPIGTDACDRDLLLPGPQRVLVEALAAVLATAARLGGGAAMTIATATDDAGVGLVVDASAARIGDEALSGLFDWRSALLAEHAGLQLRPLLARRLIELIGGNLAAIRHGSGLRFVLRLPGGAR